MLEIIDMHCHILPGLDDGADCEETSLAMLMQSYKRGVQAVIATPHASSQFPSTDAETIRRMCKRLEQRVSRMLSVDFPIYPGQEIFATADNLRRLEQGELLTLAGSRYVLLELQPSAVYSELYRVVRAVINMGYTPILAHIERYETLYRNPKQLADLAHAGALFQINSHSLEGGIFDERTRWCKNLIKKQKIQFIASDMHNMNPRGPIGKDAIRWIIEKNEKLYAEAILGGHIREQVLS